MKLRIIFSCLLLIAISSVNTIAGPTAIQYQGRLTDSAGQPVPDGDYQITFSLYTSIISRMAEWSSKPTTAKVQGGVFTTSFAPPQSVFLENDNLWLQAQINSDALPKVHLQTVPYSVRANSADIAKTVADGSITTSKLALDVALARAQFVTGITSSLPAGLTVQFYLDNVQISGSPVLSVPYAEEITPVWYQDGEERFMRIRPGSFKAGTVTIRRAISTDNTLKTLYLATKNATVVRKPLSMVLMNGTTEVTRWAFTNAWVRSYKYRIADDGLPVEEIAFAFDGAVARTSAPGAVSAPQQKYLEQGFVSGLPAGTTCQLFADGALIPDIAIASDVAAEHDIVNYIDSSDGSLHSRPGSMWTKRVTVRQNPMSNSYLATWYHNALNNSTIVRKTLLLGLLTNGVSQPLMQYSHAWPCSYTLRIADDGMPVEEFQIVYESFELPSTPVVVP